LNDEQNVAVEKEAETTTQTESPQVEAPAIEEQTTQDQPDQVENEEALDVKSEAKSKDPRDYQIERLAKENRRLKESEKQGSAFDTFKVQNQPVTTQVDVNNYADEYGSVNWNAYNAAINSQIQQVARTQASEAVAEQIDENNARTKYPELFADEDTEKQMAAMWLWEKTQGNNVSVSDIAERYAKRNSKDVSKAEKRGAEKMLQEVSTKEQAGLAATGQTSQGSRLAQSEEDRVYLSEQTRVGNQDAIVARLQTIPWANK